MVQKSQKLLLGKLGEDEAPKQKFQLTCNAKNTLLNRRKKLMEGKKDSQGDNSTHSINNQEVFQRLNSPKKKTITLQVGTPKLSIRRNEEEEEDEIRESVSQLKQKKEQQQQQASSKYSMDSPMLKSRNSTPQIGSSNSLQSQKSIGLRTPKTPILSTPTRISSNTPQTPSNVKKILLSSPLQISNIKHDNLLLNKERFDLDDQGKDYSNKQCDSNQRNKNGRTTDCQNSNSLECEDLNSLDSSNSSISSIDSFKSSSPFGNNSKDRRMKTREIHNSLLKDLDIFDGEDETSSFTLKHSIKIDVVGIQYINKKEKRLFDWYQNVEDEEEEQKQLLRQDEQYQRMLQEQSQNQNTSCINLINPDAAQVMQYKRSTFYNNSNLNNNSNNNLDRINSPIFDNMNKNSKLPSPYPLTYNKNVSCENNKNNSQDEISSPSVYSRGSPQMYDQGSPYSFIQPNQTANKRKLFNIGSPCIQVNKQYFRYLIRDTIRKYSYEPQLDTKIKPIPQKQIQVRSCPQNNTFRSQFNLEEGNSESLRSLIKFQQTQKPRDERVLLGSLNNHKLSSSKKDLTDIFPRNQKNGNKQVGKNVNSQLIKQIRDNLDISGNVSSKILSDKSQSEKGEQSQSESGSEDEKEKLQQRIQFFERKNVKKKSTFYQQKVKETNSNSICNTEQNIITNLKIVEEVQIGSSQYYQEDNDQISKSTDSKKTIITKQNYEEKSFNQRIKSKLSNMSVQNDEYGDQEDISPYIRKSNKIIKKIQTESFIQTKKQETNNCQTKKIFSQKDSQKVKSKDYLQINSTTSIQDISQNKMQDEENNSRKNDLLLFNLLSDDEECFQQKRQKITIANTIIQRSKRQRLSQISQCLISPPIIKYNKDYSFNTNPNQMNYDHTIPITSPNLLAKNILKKSQSSFTYLSIPQQANQLDQISSKPLCFPSQQSFTLIQNKNQSSLDQLPISQNHNIYDPISQNIQDTLEHNNKDISLQEQDLILKILLRQETSSVNSTILKHLEEKSQSSNSEKCVSQENISNSQLANS